MFKCSREGGILDACTGGKPISLSFCLREGRGVVPLAAALGPKRL